MYIYTNYRKSFVHLYENLPMHVNDKIIVSILLVLFFFGSGRISPPPPHPETLKKQCVYY